MAGRNWFRSKRVTVPVDSPVVALADIPAVKALGLVHAEGPLQEHESGDVFYACECGGWSGDPVSSVELAEADFLKHRELASG